jgi:hypothetical protein
MCEQACIPIFAIDSYDLQMLRDAGLETTRWGLARAPHILISFPTHYTGRCWSDSMHALPERGASTEGPPMASPESRSLSGETNPSSARVSSAKVSRDNRRQRPYASSPESQFPTGQSAVTT